MIAEIAKLTLISVVALLLAGRAMRRALRRRPGSIQAGPWGIDLNLSSEKADLNSRARDARYAPYALPAPEAIYYAAFTDSAGNKLRRGCTYTIEGTDPDTRWWSLAAYSGDRLIPNPRNRYSFTKTTVTRGADGSWHVVFSPREHAGNWLPSASEDGALKLVLRCYGPSAGLLAHPAAAPLPLISPGDAR